MILYNTEGFMFILIHIIVINIILCIKACISDKITMSELELIF